MDGDVYVGWLTVHNKLLDLCFITRKLFLIYKKIHINSERFVI